VITTPGNISQSNDAGLCSAVVSFSATATNNCGPVTISYSHAPGSSFPVGSTLVRVTAVDVTGNTSAAVFTVTVTDTEKPVVITKPVSINLSNGAVTISPSLIDGGSTDNCGIASLSVSPSAFSCADIGVHTITLTVTDIHGNVSSAPAKVTVTGEIPVIGIASVPSGNVYTGGNPNNLYLGYGAQSTVLKVTPSANTNTYSWSGNAVSLLSSTTSAEPVFTPTSAGYYTFTVLVTNQYGCATTSTISICVRDIRVPGSNGAKVYICHVPSGNSSASQTLSISVSAVAAHLSNHSGDKLGRCDMAACTISSLAGATSSAIIQSATPEKSTSANTEDELKVTVMPNPSNTFFTLKLESRFQTLVSMRVMDAAGRVVDARSKIGSNSTLEVGQQYSNGTYYAEMIQGSRRKVVRLVKGKG
jgi:PKD repeat protein